jgi:septal ring factor EnvC (AmiA/AmiB activator)
MVSAIMQRVFLCAALAALTLGVPGCASRSYELKAVDEKKQADAARREAESKLEVAKKAEAKAAQLENDLDAAKNEAIKERAARLAAEAKIKELEQKNGDLKKRIPKPEAANKTFSGQTSPERSP